MRFVLILRGICRRMAACFVADIYAIDSFSVFSLVFFLTIAISLRRVLAENE